MPKAVREASGLVPGARVRFRVRDGLIEIEPVPMEVSVERTADETWRTLRRARRRGVIGGQTYDMLIAASALKAGATTIITWNARYFAASAREIEIAVPRP